MVADEDDSVECWNSMAMFVSACDSNGNSKASHVDSQCGSHEHLIVCGMMP
jgi:hypothetical protein